VHDEVSTFMYVHVSTHVGSLGGFIHAALSLNYYAIVRGQLRSLRLECFPSQGLVGNIHSRPFTAFPGTRPLAARDSWSPPVSWMRVSLLAIWTFSSTFPCRSPFTPPRLNDDVV
jgi:hypothetical protein